MKPLINIFFFLLAYVHAVSQNLSEKYINVEPIGINKGLSQGMINCIAQDHYGFMWFGTMDGLNRYDGYKFQVFRNVPFDDKSISGNYITSIFEDSKKRLWIGTAIYGLNLFIPGKEQFIHFNMDTKPALSNNTILSIQEDKYGAIWISTKYGLNKLTVEGNYNDKTLLEGTKPAALGISVDIKKIPLNDAYGKELFTVAYSTEPCFLIAKSGTIWASASGLIYKIIASKSGKDSVIKENEYLYRQKERGIYGQVVKITEDTASDLVCFKGGNFFTFIDGKTGRYNYWNRAPFDLKMGRNQVVWNNGTLWDRASGGLFCFDLWHKKIYHVRAYNTELDKLLQFPFSVYKDRSGIIWVGTSGYGLLKYNPRTELFHNVRGKSILWMRATPKGNVIAIEGYKFKYLIKDTSMPGLLFIEDTIINDNIKRSTKEGSAMAVQDGEGTFWLEANPSATFNQKEQRIRFLKDDKDVIFPYFLDNRDRLWYGTRTSLCLFNKINNTATRYNFPVTGQAGSPYQFCEAIIQDKKGIFWIGTTEGLLSFNEATLQWRQYKNNLSDSSSLSANIIFSICDDPNKPGEYLWIGTNGSGLNRLCVSTGKFDHIGLKEGLPNMVVYGILADEDKRLWMSTNNGIACLKTRFPYNGTKTATVITPGDFKCFYEESGLQSNEFNRYAYCKTKDGTLFFGGVSGFNYFNPRQVSTNENVPNVVITDFKISNKTVVFNEGNKGKTNEKQLLSRPVFLTTEIELPYSLNIFSFDFASLDFTSPEKNLYQYTLEGFDKEWIQSSYIHTATYTNLDPGHYVFKVKGSNSDGLWNDNGASIHLTILTPWYMTWWYKLSLSAAVVIVLFLLLRFLLQQKLKLHTIRNHIASDLHDEIGSTLSSVYIYSEVAQKENYHSSTQTNSYLKQISADAGNMIEALSDIVWTVNAKNDRFENIINRMRASAIELFEAKGFELHLQFAEELNLLNLWMDKRKNFYLIYKEAINNAAKYSDGKNIWIDLSYQKPYIHLSVKDDGKGFILNDKTAGNGLSNLQKRTLELNGKIKIVTSPGNGTSVQLTFPV